MATTLPFANDCCNTCDDATPVQVPGSPGSDGAAGADGANGVNAFTNTTAAFAMPAEGANVSVGVGTTAWMAVGQPLYVQTAGFMFVASITNSNTVVLTNPENTASSAYLINAAPATNIPSSSKVAPGGVQGPSGTLAGAAGGDLKGNYPNPLIAKGNAKGAMIVGDAVDSQSYAVGANGTISHADSTVALGQQWRGVDLSGVNTTLTGAVPITSGGTGQSAKTAAFDALSPNTTRGDITVRGAAVNQRLALGAVSTVAQSDGTDLIYALLTSANFATAAKFLGGAGILGSLVGANFNSTADQAITMAATRYIIRRIIVTTASISLTTAAGGFYSVGGKAGTIIVAAAQVYSALTTNTKFIDTTLTAAVLTGGDVLTVGTIYLSLTTAQGVAATANVYVIGDHVA